MSGQDAGETPAPPAIFDRVAELARMIEMGRRIRRGVCPRCGTPMFETLSGPQIIEGWTIDQRRNRRVMACPNLACSLSVTSSPLKVAA